MRRPRALERDERGFSLIEVLLAATLLTLVLGVALSGLYTLTRSSTKAQVQTFSQAQNRVGMERLTRLLRQATLPPASTAQDPPVLDSAHPNSVAFYSRLAGSGDSSDPNNTVYRWTVDLSGADLRIGRSTCTVQSGTCSWSTPVMQTLVTNVQNAMTGGPCTRAKGAAPASTFEYYQAAASDGTLAAPLAEPVALGQVVYVKVNLFTQQTAAGDSQTCQPLTGYVELRNVNSI
jgi:prepilin-type N-terminal cleavage/methylation domain-containing protein